MTDSERFVVVLRELADLMLELYAVGLSDDVVLIGAQVVALEQRSRNEPVFEIALPTGTKVLRAFSFEPDIVIDTENLDRLAALPDALRRQGFERAWQAGKPSRWAKRVGDVDIELDLFHNATCDEDDLPTPMTRLRGAPKFLNHEIRLHENRSIRVPAAYSFLSLKLEAKLRIRPGQSKDSLDIFAYARVVGTDVINLSLSREADGTRVRRELRQLFGAMDADGVQDVVAAVGATLSPDEQKLLARAVVDTFEPILTDAETPA